MATKKFKCNVCGYIHEGDAAPANCPVCGVPASEFSELKHNILDISQTILGDIFDMVLICDMEKVKHQVRPGLTGWAQVNGYRGDTSIRKRIDCDLYYIENWSIGFDIKILFLTIFKGFINKNAY